MTETRKLAAILAADIAGYGRLTATDQERTIARLPGLRTDLIDPAISVHHGHVIKRTGDGILIEFRSVVDAVRCSIEVQSGMVERNAELVPERQILFRVGIHLGDVIEEADGDLMGEGVNIASRLENICEPGAICLSDDAYRQVKSRLDLAVTDLGKKELKNIPETVHVFAIGVGQPEKARPAEPPRLSIVVLPFANIGGDPEQEYFVDGVTESLTTDLSRIAGLFVIARNTAFTYKGKPVDVKQIGRELNVRYVLEGSLQRGGNRLRVDVQLVEAGTGNHLLAERFDKPIGDLFEMQDEIVAHLANQLGAELVALEARRVEQALNPDSMDLYFRGQTWLNRGTTSDLLGRARDFFERALVLDPGNVSASVGVAATDCIVGGAHLTDNQLSRLTAAEAWLTRTLSLAPNNAQAHFWLGNVFVFTKRADQGIAEFERALALDRNLANAHAFIGFAKAVVGRPAETEGHVQEAIRLSPRDTLLYVWTHCIAFAKFALGAEAEAVVWYRRVIEINRNIPLSHFLLAAALARLGQFDEAKAAVLVGLTLDPRFTIRRYRGGEGGDNPNYLAQRQRLIDGMRKAGVPEG
jgi:TolB-like protein/Flp pilus assembly protein TadD